MPIDNIIDFIVYVLPGFIASEIYYSHYPVKERAPLTQLAQSVIGGVIIVSFLRWLDLTYLAGALHTSATNPPDMVFVASIIFSGVAVGYLISWQYSLRGWLAQRFSWLSWLYSDPDNIWQFVNRPSVEDWVVVYLNKGGVYLGWISMYRFDPDAEDQDFLLSNARRVDDQLNVIYPIDGIGVYLNTRDISRIEFVKSEQRKN